MKLLFFGGISAPKNEQIGQQASPVSKVAARLGYLAASRGHTIILGSARATTADHYVMEGIKRFCQDHPTRHVPVQVNYPDYVSPPPYQDLDKSAFANIKLRHQSHLGLPPHDPYPQMIAHRAAIEESDAIITMGGGEGTYKAGLTALSEGRPLFPIRAFGGSSERLFHETRSHFVANPELLHLLSSDWDTQPQGIEERVNGILDAVEKIRSKQGLKITVPSPDQQVDFAIITIREDEYAAVKKRFPKSKQVRCDRWSYDVARIEISATDYYTVAIARTAEQGPGWAQQLANCMIEDLNPQWIMVVGIGGAGPSTEFTLGDVIVATRFVDFSVGAALEGKPNEWAAGGGVAHHDVLRLATPLAGQQWTKRGWNTPSSISKKVPQVTLDPSRFYGSTQWQHKTEQALAAFFADGRKSHVPSVTTGAIAVGGTLMKDASLFAEWQSHARQIIGVEMESGGVFIAASWRQNPYPFLAIRGVSDIVGFRREPEWTAYACETAAAFARAMILSRPLDMSRYKADAILTAKEYE